MDRRDRFPSILRAGFRFIPGLVVVTLLVINVGGWLFYGKARDYMERATRDRLIGVARAVAVQIDRDRILALEPGDERLASYGEEIEKLEHLRDEADLDRVFLFAPYLGSLLDTRPGIRVGDEDPLVDIDSEIMGPLWEGKPVGLPVREYGGERFQSAFVPLIEQNELRAVIGVEANARFLSDLETLRRGLFLTALLSLVLAAGLGLFVWRNTRRIIAIQAEFKNAERLAALGTLTAGLAHEIRNPLAIIRASAELLDEEEREEGRKTAFGEPILEEVDRLSELLSRFLEFAKPVDLKMERSDLCGLARETIERLRPDFIERGIRISPRLPGGEIAPPMDRERIVQVLLNLILNAGDAVGEGGGRVEVSVERRDKARPSARVLSDRDPPRGYAELCVTDDGHGIPEMIVDKLFDPFFTTKEKGTGLGLSIVHGIIRSHDGYLFVEHSNESGTSIGFGLPL